MTCDENIFLSVMMCDENIFCVWWKYFLSCDENIFCQCENIFCRVKIFFIDFLFFGPRRGVWGVRTPSNGPSPGVFGPKNGHFWRFLVFGGQIGVRLGLKNFENCSGPNVHLFFLGVMCTFGHPLFWKFLSPAQSFTYFFLFLTPELLYYFYQARRRRILTKNGVFWGFWPENSGVIPWADWASY